MSLPTAVLLLFVCVAAWTDARQHKIFNWTTYPGIVAGIACGAIAGGWEGAEAAVVGFLACGLVMLVCYVFFPDMGGGDVKLIAMMGAGLGLHAGVLAMLWTFVIGFVGGLCYLVWNEGAVRLVYRLLSLLREAVVMRGRVQPTENEDSPLNRWLFLGPAALISVIIVKWPEVQAVISAIV
ncbi:MAG: prepilin peptidase [Planctomycetota bacterium]|nr:MAG: prepilin peptidase [Planctomycetota bacterium]REJ88884.1 MAG: prepilin peptidase [Planctomycetota bacterium]REK21276.1 MAG: prepilin peptidase [Planctomycetota bacterium]REK32069.1 MAG: prepilin peptidase [Planctomycetota bacterium]